MKRKSARRAPRPTRIKVAFTQQQWQLLDRLQAEKRWGPRRADVVRSVLRDYAKARRCR